mmetsp:Transcript_6351/g.22704  ORF Transcript_6351/g.22704 Transcript_6351/m.22704 type:complete len:211 (-) Transcript_6351:4-636(-)
MIHATSIATSLPRYSMLRKISVVITKQLAFSLMVTSPVIRPTSEKISLSSRNFWLLSALRGDVYTTLCPSRSAIAMAYSATTVLPALVCAATITLSPRSMQFMDVYWKGSRLKGYFLAGSATLGGGPSHRSPFHPCGNTVRWVQVFPQGDCTTVDPSPAEDVVSDSSPPSFGRFTRERSSCPFPSAGDRTIACRRAAAACALPPPAGRPG